MSSVLYAYLYERNCLWKLNRNSGRFLHNCNFYMKHLGILQQRLLMISAFLDVKPGTRQMGTYFRMNLLPPSSRENNCRVGKKLIIDRAELVVQTVVQTPEFLIDHKETQHVRINFLCSLWPCSPSIYFFLWVSCFRRSKGHSVGPIYHRLHVSGITLTAL